MKSLHHSLLLVAVIVGCGAAAFDFEEHDLTSAQMLYDMIRKDRQTLAQDAEKARIQVNRLTEEYDKAKRTVDYLSDIAKESRQNRMNDPQEDPGNDATSPEPGLPVSVNAYEEEEEAHRRSKARIAVDRANEALRAAIKKELQCNMSIATTDNKAKKAAEKLALILKDLEGKKKKELKRNNGISAKEKEIEIELIEFPAGTFDNPKTAPTGEDATNIVEITTMLNEGTAAESASTVIAEDKTVETTTSNVEASTDGNEIPFPTKEEAATDDKLVTNASDSAKSLDRKEPNSGATEDLDASVVATDDEVKDAGNAIVDIEADKDNETATTKHPEVIVENAVGEELVEMKGKSVEEGKVTLNPECDTANENDNDCTEPASEVQSENMVKPTESEKSKVVIENDSNANVAIDVQESTLDETSYNLETEIPSDYAVIPAENGDDSKIKVEHQATVTETKDTGADKVNKTPENIETNVRTQTPNAVTEVSSAKKSAERVTRINPAREPILVREEEEAEAKAAAEMVHAEKAAEKKKPAEEEKPAAEKVPVVKAAEEEKAAPKESDTRRSRTAKLVQEKQVESGAQNKKPAVAVGILSVMFAIVFC